MSRGVFALMVASFAFILFVFPKADDDWWAWIDLTKRGVWGAMCHRTTFDVARIGNMLGMLLLLVPRWIPAALEAICFAVGFYFMTKVATIELGEWRKMALLAFLTWCFPMWENSMFSQMYAFNYIVPMPLLFGMIWMFINQDRCRLWIGVICGILLGLWHEGYAIAFVSGALLNMAVLRGAISKTRVILVISVLIGFSWLLFTPALMNRQDFFKFKAGNIIQLWYSSIYFVYILTVLICLSVKKLRLRLQSSNLGLQLFAVASGILMPLVALTGIARAMMPCILITCCAFSVLLSKLFSEMSPIKKIVFAALLTLFTSISLVATCIQTIKLRPMAEFMERAYLDNLANGSVFGPICYPWNYPAVVLRRPDTELLLKGRGNASFLRYLTDNEKLMIVPWELSEYKYGLGEPISRDSVVRLWEGHIISSQLSDTLIDVVEVDYGLKKDFIHAETTSFKGADNREYVYILPYRTTLSTYLGAPRYIETFQR